MATEVHGYAQAAKGREMTRWDSAHRTSTTAITVVAYTGDGKRRAEIVMRADGSLEFTVEGERGRGDILSKVRLSKIEEVDNGR